MVVSLTQLPMKILVMDIVVLDIPSRFGMLLSRCWSKKLRGTLQMDMSYATILVFGGEFRRLYREIQMAYIISDQHNPSNHPIYVEEKELGSSILHLVVDDNELQPQLSEKQHFQSANEHHSEGEQIWKLYFDGTS